jgi:tetratricopeptide (TPR) repeat protein
LLGEIFDEMGDYRKALACFELILELPQGKVNRQKLNSVLKEQANCYYNLHDVKRAIEIYSSLFVEQNQPADFRANVGLGLAASFIENEQSSEARQILADVEIIIHDYDGLDTFVIHFARLWKYRAFVAHALNENNVALECARKSIDYWIKLLDSDFEEKQMRDLVTEIEGDMRLGGEAA